MVLQTKLDKVMVNSQHVEHNHAHPRWLTKFHGSLINNNNSFDEKVETLANNGRGGSNSKQ